MYLEIIHQQHTNYYNIILRCNYYIFQVIHLDFVLVNECVCCRFIVTDFSVALSCCQLLEYTSNAGSS